MWFSLPQLKACITVMSDYQGYVDGLIEASQMKHSQKVLSNAQISVMRPGGSDLADVGENRGLRISCGNAGTKSFYYRYTSPVTGKLTQVHIGHFPSISLAEARVALQNLKNIRREKRCPASEAREARENLAVESMAHCHEKTVKEVIDLYLTQHIEDRRINGKSVEGARNRKGQDETRRTLYGDVVRQLGTKPATSVNRKDVVNLVMAIVSRGANVQAGNVLRELSAAYEYSIGLDRFSDDFANPALLAKASLRQAKVKLTAKKGRRVFSDQELKLFLEWLPSSMFTPTQKRILMFTLWTGCRTGEVCAAQWQDVDLSKQTWHLRITKTGIERRVQLSDQAVIFLKPLMDKESVYVFPSTKRKLPIKQKAITEQAWNLRKTGRMVNIDHWSPHDLRRTVRTGLSRLGCPSEVAEAILGHSRSGIEGTYDLHRYERESRIWLQRWADHIESL